VLLASAPPSGIIGAVLRTARHDPLGLLKSNLTLSLYPLVATPEKARERLFSERTPEEIIASCHPRLQDESFRAFLDMIVLDLPRPERFRVPVLVLGAAEDGIFSPGDVERTARAYHTEATIFPGMGHNMMLEPGWEEVMRTIITWLGEQGL
jgi:pimeloyl-ACP methyl ester carboxylesterase